MEENSNSSKTKRNRVSWKPVSIVKTFLEACLHEIAINGREGVGLKVLSWKKVAQVVKDNHNFEVDQKQMKNHFDYLKIKYTTWLSLRNKTGNIYDESTNTFNLSEEEWKIEILLTSLLKKNKNFESLKTTTLPFRELCAPFIDGTLSTCIKSNGPSSTDSRRVVEPHVVEDGEDIEVVNIESPTPPCSSRLPCRSGKTNKKGKQMDIVEEEILSVLKVIADKIIQPGPSPTSESPPKSP
ncbi:myb/SANT-like domain-containing protein [Artemisia annua]|uniref:Myb/SANT-like domain-containing protein n=1 Tax=Artemisia annua TaxID=35608 RepID=A0A2U1Q5T1_ARTAN|nr:myb/SANT-like domain-containing protein [Artemisia annua]